NHSPAEGFGGEQPPRAHFNLKMLEPMPSSTFGKTAMLVQLRARAIRFWILGSVFSCILYTQGHGVKLSF
ncbi:MAG: hypothetical protein K2O70_01580, partial [Desulfovibrionaceae bacterium]|nr:hypothetical protein [Desulfovibrionaceae bacterium]